MGAAFDAPPYRLVTTPKKAKPSLLHRLKSGIKNFVGGGKKKQTESHKAHPEKPRSDKPHAEKSHSEKSHGHGEKPAAKKHATSHAATQRPHGERRAEPRHER